MKGRNSQVARIYMILNILEGAPHGLSVSEIHSRLENRGFEVELRTVYRDLDALKAAGFPMDQKGKSDENGTRWTLERTAKVTHYLALNSRELMGLYLARGMLTPLKDTPFFLDLEAAFNKISEKLPKNAREHVDELEGEFFFDPGPRWGLGIDPGIVDTVRSGCSERHLLKIKYQNAKTGIVGERDVGPHFLYFAKGSLYFVAEDIAEKKLKTFSVPRIQEATLLELPYEAVPVEPDTYFAGSFGIFKGSDPVEIRLEFNSTVAPYVKERRWHPSQSVVSKTGGRIELTLEVGITPDLVQWVLGFGSNVRVIENSELIVQICQAARLTFEMYSDTEKAS